MFDLSALLRRVGIGAPAPPDVGALGPLPTTIDEVIARMQEIDGRLPKGDGVAWFNRMYMRVTEKVREASRSHDFEDTEFLEHLDVAFANVFFAALEQAERDPPSCPKAWAPLFAARSNRRIAPIQFALAGMNAHINHDLVVAVVESCAQTGRVPADGSAVHRDFMVVNRILAEAQEEVEPMLKRGLLAVLDRVLGRADEVVQMWSIERARQAAWTQSQALWSLRDAPALDQNFRTVLARTIGFAGRGMLIPRLF